MPFVPEIASNSSGLPYQRSKNKPKVCPPPPRIKFWVKNGEGSTILYLRRVQWWHVLGILSVFLNYFYELRLTAYRTYGNPNTEKLRSRAVFDLTPVDISYLPNEGDWLLIHGVSVSDIGSNDICKWFLLSLQAIGPFTSQKRLNISPLGGAGCDFL